MHRPRITKKTNLFNKNFSSFNNFVEFKRFLKIFKTK
jgi:hypothetical protein